MIQISSPQNNVLGQVSMAVKTPEIQSITILEGDQDVTASEVIQYVNLPRDSKFVNPAHGISHIDRLGRKIRCKVTFNVVGQFKFKVKLIPDSSNVVYTATEKANNTNFCYSEGEIEFTTDSTGEKIIEADQLFVTPAGNDIFTISAEDSAGNVKKSTTQIRTRRMMYYMLTYMSGTSFPGLSLCFMEYHNQGIDFQRLPPVQLSTNRNIIPSIPTEPEYISFMSEVNDAIKETLKTYSPYCIKIALANNMGYKRTQAVEEKQIFSGGTTKIRLKYSNYLWINDKNNISGSDWFYGGHFVKANGQKINITKNMCTPVQSKPNEMKQGFYDCMDVDLSSITPPENGNLKVVANIFEIKGGGSDTNNRAITLATKTLDREIPDEEKIPIMIHEIGHQLGMVSDGNNKLPEPPPFHYTGRGHNGNHCHCGLPPKQKYDNIIDSPNATCVMFGVAFAQRTSFCNDCKTVLKKIDLS